MYRLYFKPQALRDLYKLNPSERKRITGKLEFYISQKDPLHYAERLINPKIGQYRFRIGGYRIILDLEGEQIIVLLTGHRREIYR